MKLRLFSKANVNLNNKIAFGKIAIINTDDLRKVFTLIRRNIKYCEKIIIDNK